MNVLITLTTAGADTGPFNLYSNVDNYTTAFETNISRGILEAGYTSLYVPSGTTSIRVKSVGVCTNYVDIGINVPTTTTTSTTAAPTTTSTTTAAPVGTTTTTTTYVGPSTTTTTTEAPPETTTTTTTYVGPSTTTTTSTTEAPTTTTTTTAEPTTTTTTTTESPTGCTQVTFVVMSDGAYSYSYTLCGDGPVGPLTGTGTTGEILQSGVCVENGSVTSSNVQANPTGPCTVSTTTTAAPTTTTTTTTDPTYWNLEFCSGGAAGYQLHDPSNNYTPGVVFSAVDGTSTTYCYVIVGTQGVQVGPAYEYGDITEYVDCPTCQAAI